jgi:hypothetical protein
MCDRACVIPYLSIPFTENDPKSAPQNLPAGVAMRLAAGEKIAPELHENVAVIFVGVVGRSHTTGTPAVTFLGVAACILLMH